MRRSGLCSAIAATTMLGLSSTAGAGQLNYAAGAPASVPQYQSIETYAQAVEDNSSGEYNLKIFAMTLLNFAEMSDGVRDGLADIGWVIPPYHPQAYPHSNFIGESSLMMKPFTGEHAGKEGWAFGGALTEYMFNDCPDCLAEFDAQNQVPTAFVAGTWSGLICTTPIKSLDDLDGARIRTGSANHARWAEAIGATPIQMSANEMREALDTGVADCAVLDLSNIPAYGVEESVSDITTAVPGGLFPSSPFQFNQDTWSSFSTEEREAMLKSAATGAAAILTQYREDMLTTRALMKDLGANFHEADGDVIATSEAFAKDDLKAAARSYAEKYDIQNGEQKLEDFRELLDKWRELVKDVETAEALSDLLWSEVLSGVDPATYGVK